MNAGGKRGAKILGSLRGLFSRGARSGERKPYTATFSAPMLIGAAVVLACAIGWAFYMGLMVGRGQNPAAEINDLTGGLLNSGTPEKVAESDAAADETETTAPQAIAGAERERPEGAALDAWPNPAQPKAANEKPKSAKETGRAKPERNAKDAPKPTNQASYDFVYQVAAVKSAKDAETLDKKLKSLGLRSETRKSGKVHLLIVSLRGKDADALAMRDKLRAAKLGKPLLLSKKERTGGKANKK